MTVAADGNVVAQRRYEAYGQGRWSRGEEQTDIGFNSHREESEFGLYDYQARYFSPLLGRFISADTIVPDYANPQSLNRYAYVYNNPLKYIDPTGHCGIVGGGAGNPAVMSHSCLEALGGAAVAYAVVAAANQFDVEVDLDLNLNRPSSSPPIQVSSTDIFVLEYPETEGQRPVLLAPEHIMHTPPMDLNPDLDSISAPDNLQIPSFFTSRIRNQHLAGSTHPRTGVPFNAQGFPVFSSVHDVTLPASLIGPSVSDTQQFSYATNQLKNYLEANPALKANFTPQQLQNIENGGAYINDYTWHHHEDGVRLQLVDREIHRRTGHSGGRQQTGGCPR